MKKALIVCAFVAPFIIPAIASAQVANVSNVHTNVSSIYSGQPAGITWTLNNSSGSWYQYPCMDGVSFINADDNSALTCGTKYLVDNTNGGAASTLINNVSGATKTVTVQIIPKDLSGNSYDAGTTQTQITVYPLAEPITSVSWNPIVATSGEVATLSWTGVSYLTGVNINILCNSNVYITSTNYTDATYVPCGRPIFTTDLSYSGSVPFTFTNLAGDRQSMTVQVIPAIKAGTYDGTHAKSIGIDVVTKAAIVLSVDSFAASASSIQSGKTVDLTWKETNAAGANFTLNCDGFNIIATSSLTGSTVLSCNRQYILSSDATSSGAFTLGLKNMSGGTQPVTVTIVPSPSVGSYDATKSRSVTINVVPPGGTTTNTPSYGSSPNTAPTPTPGNFKKARITFTRMLKYGIVSDDVKALQEFLSQDPSVYPEAMTTGFYGPLTTKAIQRFQAKYGIITSGTPESTGYGWFGPKTRAFVNTNFK